VVTVARPIVRSFALRWAASAAEHVRAGGHAVVWRAPDRAFLVIRPPAHGDVLDLGRWAIYDLGLSRWRVAKDGPLAGLALVTVPRDSASIVRGWAERDSAHGGVRRSIALDCLACAACCVKNEVILEERDLRRWKKMGLMHLSRRPWARRDADGRIVLVLTKGGRCKHLARDNKCGIYEARPHACSDFPPGSECCLYAREEELGLVDGAEVG
jgi:Fe-S-cluster containining protein